MGRAAWWLTLLLLAGPAAADPTGSLDDPSPTIPEALNAPDWSFANVLQSPWWAQTNTTHDGLHAAQSGQPAYGEESRLETVVTGPGQVAFWWRVASPDKKRGLTFSIDGTARFSISGEQEWAHVVVDVPAGPRELAWTYGSWDTSNPYGNGWLDEVAYFSGTGLAPYFNAQPTNQLVQIADRVTLRADVSAGPSAVLQWYRGSTLLPGGTNATLVIPRFRRDDIGTYCLVVSNALGAVTSRVANVSALVQVPTSHSMLAGEELALEILAEGAGPFTYQWYVPGGATLSKTNTLALKNLSARSTPSTVVVRVKDGLLATKEVVVRIDVFSPDAKCLPLQLEGWSHDVVVEAAPSPYSDLGTSYGEMGAASVPLPTTSMDALPAARRLGAVHTSNYTRLDTNVVYEFQPYAGSNALMRSIGAPPRTLRLQQPGRYRSLRILQSGFNGTDSFPDVVVLGFEDPAEVVAWRPLEQAYSFNRQALVLPQLKYLAASNQWVATSGAALGELRLDLTAFGLADRQLTSLSFARPWPAGALTRVDQGLQVLAVSGERTDGAQPPTILRDPESVLGEPGEAVVLRTLAIGTPPLSLQWRCNGLSIEGATERQLEVAELEPGEARFFDVTVSNAMGVVTSATACVSLPGPPRLVSFPTNQEVDADSMVFLRPEAVGLGPMICQWRANGTNLAWATNLTLVLTNVTGAINGKYDLLLSNDLGSLVSPEVKVTVRPYPSLEEATDAPELTWHVNSPSAWVGQTNSTHDGVDALKCGSLVHQDSAEVAVDLQGPGILSFWYYLDDHAELDFQFYVDVPGLPANSFCQGWHQHVVTIPEGAHQAVWRFRRATASWWQDELVYLDQVSFTPATSRPRIVECTELAPVLGGDEAKLEVAALSMEEMTFQWLKDGEPIVGATGTNYTIPRAMPADAGNYSVAVSNRFGMVYSEAQALVVERPTWVLALLGQWGTEAPSGFRRFQVAGNHAYLASREMGLVVLDLHDPHALRLVSQLDVEGGVTDLQVTNNMAYLACSKLGLQIVDVSDPGNPKVLGTSSPFMADGVQVTGQFAFLSSRSGDPRVVDVSNPATPAVMSANPSWLGVDAFYGICLAGPYAYLADEADGLQVLEVRNPQKPVWIGGLRGMPSIRGVRVSGNRACVGNPTPGWSILDVSDPLHLAVVGEYNVGEPRFFKPTPGSLVGVRPTDLWFEGDLAYLACGSNGLHVVNLAIPSQPTEVASCRTRSRAVDVQVDSGKVYLLDDVAGLLVLEPRPGAESPLPPIIGEPHLSPGGLMAFPISGESGCRYSLEASRDLKQWQPVTTITATTAVTMVEVPSGSGDTQVFYRVQASQ